MIEFSQDDKDTVIEIDTRIIIDTKSIKLNFRMDRGCKLDAKLLKNQIEREFELTISEIRKDAYNKGWKDKASHKTKRTWFPSWISRVSID